MKSTLTLCFGILLLVVFQTQADASLLDLSTWTEITLDLPGGQSAGNWVLSDANTAVTQTINADPSFFLNNLNQTNYSMDGTWSVLEIGGDNDFIGFVFGYQNSSHFYIMDWKQANQSDPGGYGGTALEGFSIKKIAADNVSDLVLADFWVSAGATHSTILASNFSTTNGWADNTEYKFHLDFAPGIFTVIVKNPGDTELWNVTVNDNTHPSGQFGFYNFSQQDVRYAGFTQTGGEIVDGVIPEPSSLLLLGFGVLGAGFFRSRKGV